MKPKAKVKTAIGYTKKGAIVETNLKQEDLDLLSTRMGEEIAMIVIDKIISSQSSKPRAIVRKSADNIYSN